MERGGDWGAWAGVTPSHQTDNTQRIDEEGRVADLPRGEFGSVADRRVDEGSVAA